MFSRRVPSRPAVHMMSSCCRQALSSPRVVMIIFGLAMLTGSSRLPLARLPVQPWVLLAAQYSRACSAVQQHVQQSAAVQVPTQTHCGLHCWRRALPTSDCTSAGPGQQLLPQPPGPMWGHQCRNHMRVHHACLPLARLLMLLNPTLHSANAGVRTALERCSATHAHGRCWVCDGTCCR